MNANELADKWDAQGFSEYELERECGNQMANMLRQQQAEIETYKLELYDEVMLRREQQAEIEALKAAKIRAYNNGVEDGRKPDTNNKPVAWMYNYENFPDSFVVCRARKSDQDIPLYTHPVKEHFEDEPQAEELHEIMQSNAELTDEEILQVLKSVDADTQRLPTGFKLFARAILRKAQEK